MKTEAENPKRPVGRPKKDEKRIKMSLTLPESLLNQLNQAEQSQSTIIELALNQYFNNPSYHTQKTILPIVEKALAQYFSTAAD